MQENVKDYITRLILIILGTIITIFLYPSQWPLTVFAGFSVALTVMPKSIISKVRFGMVLVVRGIWTIIQVLVPLGMIWYAVGAVNHATDAMDNLYLIKRMCEDRKDAAQLEMCTLAFEFNASSFGLQDAWIDHEIERIRKKTIANQGRNLQYK